MKKSIKKKRNKDIKIFLKIREKRIIFLYCFNIKDKYNEKCFHI